MFNKKLLPAIISFFILMLILVFTVFMPKSYFSEVQNKSLTPLPTLNLDTLFSGSFDSNIQKYLSDHVLFKDNILSVKNNVEVALFKNEINSVAIAKDKMAENPVVATTAIGNENTEAILALMNKYGNPENFSIALIPTAIEIYRDDFVNVAINFDQLEFISKTYGLFEPGYTVDMSTGLLTQKGEKIYYNSHSNWTSLGAYSGYNSLSGSLGYIPAAKNMFDVEYINDIFYGDLYNKTLIKNEKEDTIDIYQYANGSVSATTTLIDENQIKENPSVLFREYLQTSQKQKVFLGEDSSEVLVNTTVDNDKKLLIFRDDYADPLIQFLYIHYEEIRLIDLKYADESTLNNINFDEYSNVLFIYNVIDYVEDNVISVKLQSLI